MRYIKNNGKPSNLTINNQVACGYINKKGEKKEIRVVMWRDPDPKAAVNKEAIERGLAPDKKALVRLLVRPDKRKVEETDERKDVGYVQIVTNFPHIINFPIGTSFKDERIYNVFVGQIAEIDNDSDADKLLQTFHFLDEVDQKGELIDTFFYLDRDIAVKGNPYRPLKSQKVDRRLAPTRFEEMGEDAAPRANPSSTRVRELEKAGEEDKKLFK